MAKGFTNGPHVAHQLSLDIFFFNLAGLTSYVIAFHIQFSPLASCSAEHQMIETAPTDAERLVTTQHYDAVRSDIGVKKKKAVD